MRWQEGFLIKWKSQKLKHYKLPHPFYTLTNDISRQIQNELKKCFHEELITIKIIKSWQLILD